MITHDTVPSTHVAFHERHLGRNAAIALGSVTLAAMLISGAQSDPKYDIRNNAGLSVSPSVEYAQHPEIESNSAASFHTIEQDEITGKVVEQSTLEYADLYDVTLQSGQSSVDFTSAKSIEETVHQITGGSVQPGTIIKTQLDPSTGYIISTYVTEKSK